MYGNHPYVAYSDSSFPNTITVMTYNISSWETVGMPGLSGATGTSLSLALDSGGQPYVAFSDSSVRNAVTVKTYTSGSWVTVGTQGFSGPYASSVSLALDRSGKIYVASLFGGLPTVMSYANATVGWISIGFNTSGLVSKSSFYYIQMVLHPPSQNPIVACAGFR